MKVHMSLPMHNLKETQAFYAVLLDSEPAKVKSDYLKFDPSGTALNISFHLTSTSQTVPTNRHLGFQVETEEEFRRVQERLTAAGLVSKEANESTCCYANQYKFWTTDPTGFRWEIYLLKEDSNTKMGSNNAKACC